MLTVAVVICVLAVVTTTMGDACDDVTLPCLRQLEESKANNTERCQMGEDYFQCMGTVLPQAEESGVCSEAGILEQRFYVVVDLQAILPQFQVNVRGCNIDRPAYFNLRPCETAMIPCAFITFDAFKAAQENDTAQLCTLVASCETCLQSTIPTCSHSLVKGIIARILIQYGATVSCDDLPSTTDSPPSSSPTPPSTTMSPDSFIIAVTVGPVVVVVIIFVIIVVIVICRNRRQKENERRRQLQTLSHGSLVSSEYDSIRSSEVATSIYDTIPADEVGRGSGSWLHGSDILTLGALVNPSDSSDSSTYPWSGGSSAYLHATNSSSGNNRPTSGGSISMISSGTDNLHTIANPSNSESDSSSYGHFVHNRVIANPSDTSSYTSSQSTVRSQRSTSSITSAGTKVGSVRDSDVSGGNDVIRGSDETGRAHDGVALVLANPSNESSASGGSSFSLLP